MDAQEGRESCASCAQIESHDVEGQGRRGGPATVLLHPND